MRISEIEAIEGERVGAMRDGVLNQRFLLHGEDEDSPNNYSLNVGVTGAGGWGTPRHKHNFAQIRFLLKGKYTVSPHKTMEEGTVAYFPESVHYGPQDRPDGVEMMVMQLGGTDGQGYLSVARREAANEALKSKGTFKDGIFTWYDEKGQKHNMDGSAACFEEATGKKLTFDAPRYDDVIMMYPGNYSWMETDTKGVFRKALGSFTERNLRIGALKIEAGAVWNTGARSQIEVLFLREGSITVNGKTYGSKTAIELLPSDAPVDIKAAADSDFLTILLPKF